MRIPILILLAVQVLAAAQARSLHTSLAVSLPSCMVAFSTVGDNKIEGMIPDVGSTAYSQQELLASTASLFGQQLADEIAASGKGLREIWAPDQALGVHDHDTIAINSKTDDGKTSMSLEMATCVYVHEYEHSEKAATAGTDKDLTTHGPAGACVHAQMHFDLVIAALDYVCEEMQSTGYPGEQKLAICAALGYSLKIGDHWATKCVPASGGSPPNGVPAHTNFSECCAL